MFCLHDFNQMRCSNLCVNFQLFLREHYVCEYLEVLHYSSFSKCVNLALPFFVSL
jgi:hypothetical protein